ncbi:MAG: hypothetical protein ACI92Z_000731 [Paracoccaceae bacterium]|jgi:hypothetical protein
MRSGLSLQVQMAAQHQNPANQPIRMQHLFDAFLAAFLGHVAKASVFLQMVMQPVLADRRQFAAQRRIKVFNNFWIAFHGI